MERETITLTTRDTHRIAVLAEVDRGALTAKEAATRLDLSLRQLRRLLRGWRKDGAAAVVHGNRGRQPAHTLPARIRTQIRELLASTYVRLNHQHASDLLGERNSLAVSRTTVRRLRAELGLKSPRQRRPRQFRSRRERMPQAGLLVQIDGSLHPWFGPDRPYACLLAAIDDATSAVLGAVFRPTEDLFGYYQLIQQVLAAHGVPLAVYSDRHTIHISPKADTALTIEEQLSGVKRLTQFGRCLEELGIQQIPAYSPEAKGRIERLFGTFQDRLLKEMELDEICTIEQANSYLSSFIPSHNARFAVAPALSPLLFRPLPPGLDPDYVFSVSNTRTVQRDNTVKFRGRFLQIPEGPTRRAYVKARVEVCETQNGTLAIYYKRRLIAGPLSYEDLLAHKPGAAKPARPTSHPAIPRTPTLPAPDHPWRKNKYPLKTSAYSTRKGW